MLHLEYPLSTPTLRLTPFQRGDNYPDTGGLAGALAVKLAGQLTDRGWIALHDRDYEVSPVGERGFAALGLDLPSLRRQHRLFARRCIDWSERRPHIGGALGAALMTRFQEDGWLRKPAGQRKISVTSIGQHGFWNVFGIEV